MTPEEAKPQNICIMSEMVYADGMFQGPIREGFTAKETAEIAKAYSDLKLEADAVKAWEVLFEEWSK